MGFFDSLGDALGKGASSAMNSLMEKERKIENYVEKYQYRDDEFLIRKYNYQFKRISFACILHSISEVKI